MKHGDSSAHKNNENMYFSAVTLAELILLANKLLRKYLAKCLEFKFIFLRTIF